MAVLDALAAYVAKLSIDTMDPRIVASAKNFFADGLGCMVASAHEKPIQIAKEYAALYGGKPEATIIASGEKTDVMTAALVNGISAHYLDFDDVGDTTNGHVSVVMLPTILAVGETLNASGKQLLEAYITGIEACSMVGRSVGQENFRRGWHSTASLGIFGATAAAGKLMGLSEQQLVYAFGIAASEASGLKANFGTMTKSFHAGSAASKGIRAARLASLGYDSKPEALECRCGFGDLTIGVQDFTPTYEAIESNASEFLDPGLVMKPYPSCKASHNGIDAALYLTKEYSLTPADIEHIIVEIQPHMVDLLQCPFPKNKLQGKFSSNYTIALAIANHAVTLDDFMGDDAFQPEVAELIPKIETVVNDNMNGEIKMMVRGDTIVRIFTKDGRELVKRVNYALGDPHVPLDEEMRVKKLESCFKRNLSPNRAQTLIDSLRRVDEIDTTQTLIGLLIPD